MSVGGRPDQGIEMSLNTRLISLAGWKTESAELSVPSPDSPDPVVPAGCASLYQLRTSGVAIEWYEAIAIARGLCDLIANTGEPSGPAGLRLADVFIDSSGRVGMLSRAAGSTTETIQDIGHIVSELLPARDIMFLRARLVAKATSSPPAYGSLLQLSEALEYYERPNRSDLIRAVYERWKSMAPGAIVRPPASPHAQPPPVARMSGRRELVRGAAAAAAVVAVGALILLARGRTVVPVPALATILSAPMRGADAFGSRVASILVPSHPSPTPAPAVDEAAAAPSKTVKVTPVRRPGPVRPGPAPARNAEPNAAPAADSNAASAPGPAAPSAPRAPEPLAAAVPPPAVAAADLDLTIHTAKDADVLPPRMLYPQTLTPVVPGMSRREFMTFEVVVNEGGRVDWVKARDVPQTLGESVMLLNALSTAKSWRFDPALKNDGPVRYNQLVALPIH